MTTAELHRKDSERKRAYLLHYGNTRHPLARIVPDNCWPGMWRIMWPGGRLSDILNLSRAKDAAAATAVRGPPVKNGRLFHWQITYVEKAATAPPVRRAENSAPGIKKTLVALP